MRDLRGTNERAYLSMPWGQVHLRRAGAADAPAVLMLHQSPLSSATFETVIGPLSDEGFRVVAIDTPGFGMSDPTPNQWSIEQYADACWQVADRLELVGPLLLGQHTGAVIACEAAIQRPGAVAGLVLQGLPLYSDDERADKRATYAPGYAPAPDGSHLQVIWQRVRGLYPKLPVDETNRQVLEYLATGPDYATAYRAVFEYHLKPDQLTDTPIALVHGERDLVHRFTDTVTVALPWATLDIVPGTDFAPDEHPAEFVAAVATRAREHLAARAN